MVSTLLASHSYLPASDGVTPDTRRFVLLLEVESRRPSLRLSPKTRVEINSNKSAVTASSVRRAGERETIGVGGKHALPRLLSPVNKIPENVLCRNESQV